MHSKDRQQGNKVGNKALQLHARSARATSLKAKGDTTGQVTRVNLYQARGARLVRLHARFSRGQYFENSCNRENLPSFHKKTTKQRNNEPANGVRQVGGPIFEVNRFLRVTKNLPGKRSIQVVVVTEASERLVWDFTCNQSNKTRLHSPR